uniref:Uncharacterized protein n=1 Tax=Avena sativa TaxID=4498 RepID=A0ACD5XW94_AVESA
MERMKRVWRVRGHTKANQIEADEGRKFIIKFSEEVHHQIPNKVKIFGWRTACNNLATRQNKYRKNLETYSTCSICGRETETSFHATVSYTKSRALRQEMRKNWDLPAESLFQFSGPDWLLILLAGINKDRRGLVLMILWRCWNLRNDAIHEKGEGSVVGSVLFLNRYSQELNLNCGSKNSRKGKEPILSMKTCTESKVNLIKDSPNPDHKRIWEAPPDGWIKINADASFEANNGTCSIACICRDHSGKVLWACNATGISCQDVPEAETKACLLGLQSVHDAKNASVILESDNSVVVEAIKRRNQGLSRLWNLYEQIKNIQDICLDFEVVKIRRESNQVAHMLANVARFSGQSYFWLGHVPLAVAVLVETEYVKPVISNI